MFNKTFSEYTKQRMVLSLVLIVSFYEFFEKSIQSILKLI